MKKKNMNIMKIKNLLKSKNMNFIIMSIIAASFLWYKVPTKIGIDSTIEPYLKDVRKFSNNNLNYRGLHVNYSNLKSNTLGTCFFYRKEILINKNKFSTMNYYDKILLLAHEITHCQKKKGHINKLDKKGCPAHFMHYSDFGSWCNRVNFKKYVKQMKRI